ncbi:Uncharacterised protein [Mycobacteroides abscessus subsp. abscessus]|nr:Uncharacterised protein [Mycobacteroides abscessus subsp. abscessus]
MTACTPPLTIARVILGCARDARSTASYSSSAIRVLTALTTAANGVRSGISKRGMPSSSAVVTNSGGTSSNVRPVPNPNAATLFSSSERR